MTIDPNLGAAAPGLIDRVKNILLKPVAEWDRIAVEPVEVPKLYTGYVVPLAALAAICGFIGMSVIGASAFGVTVRVPLVAGLVSAVLQVVFAVIGVYILALVANALAPTFGSQQDVGQAHKLAVYGSTASFVAGVLTILPPLAMLAILGAIYSLVLIYIGLPRLMKTPEDKRPAYFISIIAVCIVLGIVAAVLMGAVRSALPGSGFGGYTIGQNAPRPQTEVAVPGGGSVDLEALQKQAEAYASGSATSVDPQRLQNQLPQTLPGGFARTSVSSSSAMGASQAEAVYQSGAAELRVTIMHLGAMGAMTAMAAAANVQQSRQDADGYARTQTIDGRVYTEEVSTSAGSATYAVIGRGVGITAEGTGGVTLDQARAAVETIGVQRLERAFGS